MSRDKHGAGHDFTNEADINLRMDEIARLYGKLEVDDPERGALLWEIKILVRRLDEIKRLT